MGTQEVSAQAAYDGFWHKATEDIKALDLSKLKHHELPLARIKKIMKLDEDVKMISAEAPVLFSKAAELFITELTMRAWIHTEDNKRRTLQRNDIAMAITKQEQFDFLIDIVPRDDIKPTKPRDENTVRMAPDQVSYYFQLAQQQQQQPGQVQAQPAQQQAQVVQSSGAGGSQPHVIRLEPTQIVNSMAPPPGGMQIVTQIVGPNGEVQQIPIQLTSQQLQVIRSPTQQSLVIHTAPIQATSIPQGQVQQPIQLQQTPQQVFIQQQTE